MSIPKIPSEKWSTYVEACNDVTGARARALAKMWPSTRISSGLKLRRRDNFHLLRYFEVFGRHSLRHERLYETECGGLWGKGKPSVRPLRKSCHPVQSLFIDPDTNSSSVLNRFQLRAGRQFGSWQAGSENVGLEWPSRALLPTRRIRASILVYT